MKADGNYFRLPDAVQQISEGLVVTEQAIRNDDWLAECVARLRLTAARKPGRPFRIQYGTGGCHAEWSLQMIMSSTTNLEQTPNQSVLSWLTTLLWQAFFILRLSLSNCVVVMLNKLALSNCLVSWLHKFAINSFKDAADYSHAEIAYKLILRVRPDDRVATIKLADLYEHQGIPSEAARIMNDWLKCFPNDVGAHVILSNLYSGEMSETTKAKEHLENALRLAPNSPDVLESFGYFHRWNGNLDQSSEFFRLALKEQERPHTLVLLAQNLINEGKVEESARILERVLQLEPDFVGAYSLLASCGHYRDLSHPHIVYMKNRLCDSCLRPIVRSSIHGTLGVIFDKLGLWDEAFAHFKAGNDISWSWFQSHFNIDKWTEYINQEIKTFNSGFFEAMRGSGEGRSGESMIFIVGMPRSGSTLVEQILASHPDVRAGGERRDLSILKEQLGAELNEPYPSCIRRLDRQTVRNLGKRYLSRVSGLFDGYARFVDKDLHNYTEIGLISAIFPDAKVIHCQRNALDTCVSCYCSNLLACPYVHDLRTLGLVHRLYARLMSYWHSLLPGWILDVQYEALVSDPESQIRRLIEYCELPWHPECLTPYKTRRPVNTVSATQVISPINSRSVGRWKNYEKHISSLIDALSDSG